MPLKLLWPQVQLILFDNSSEQMQKIIHALFQLIDKSWKDNKIIPKTFRLYEPQAFCRNKTSNTVKGWQDINWKKYQMQ